MRALRKRLFFVVLFLSLTVYTQDYERVDATILLYPSTCKTPEELSKFISRDFNSEEEKVRAIYSWLIQNISYDPNEYKNFDYQFTNNQERNRKEEITRTKIINRTLQKGVAVCEGYAFLFEKLCELQGITNYLVRGTTKTSLQGIGEKYTVNHLWNIAYIEGKPYLFDATWGAGKYQEVFIKEPTYFYYKIAPAQMLKTHYPAMFEDALSNENLSRQEFSEMPLIIHKELFLSDIESPKKGIIHEAQYIDAIHFTIHNLNPNKISYAYTNEMIRITDVQYTNNRTTFSVPLSIGEKYLMIYFEDQPAIGYKIK